MIFGGGRSLAADCAVLAGATLRLDERASTRAYRAIITKARTAGPDELTGGVAEFVPALEQVSLGNGVRLARLVAGLIEIGADPVPVLPILAERVALGLEQAARFPALAAAIGGARAPAGPVDGAILVDRAAAAGLDPAEAAETLQAGAAVNEWVPGLLLPLQQKRARKALPHRDRLVAAARAAADQADAAGWLLGLLLVLDDEPLIVIHRATGRAYAVTISGVGENFQLHTLLAATLIGDPARGLIEGTPPEPGWVAAATDGEELRAPIVGRFTMVAADGEWIWNEGRPADIPFAAGRRVVVLDDPAPYIRTWDLGRAYPLMSPDVRLEKVLEPGRAAEWVGRIKPATVPGRVAGSS